MNYSIELNILTVLSHIMTSPGQKRGSCGNIMAGFDGHSKCARCNDKGTGVDLCVMKKDCKL